MAIDHKTPDPGSFRADVKGWIAYIGSEAQRYLPEDRPQAVVFTHNTAISQRLFDEAYQEADETSRGQPQEGFGRLSEVLRGLAKRSLTFFHAYAQSIDSISMLEEARVEFVGKKG